MQENGKNTVTVIIRRSGTSPLLTAMLLLMLMALAVTFAYKKVARVRDWFASRFKIEKVQGAAESAQGSLLEKLEMLEKEIKKNSTRTKVLGIVSNENFSALRNFPGGEEILLLERDWKMSGFPNRLEIADEDMDFIRQNVSPRQKQN